MASYKETFSAYYDALTEDVDRAKIADRCEELMARYHPKRELALDLCCGTGTLAIELARRGFEVIGVDASPEMLMQAVEKGLKGEAAARTHTLLDENEPLTLVDEALIPALDVVGEKYEKGKLFLPQLLQAASAAQAAF